MTELIASISRISKLKIKTEVVENSEGLKELLTHVGFQTKDDGFKLRDIIYALSSGVPINVTFKSDQLQFNVEVKDAEVKAA